jgi:hypothetical protein
MDMRLPWALLVVTAVVGCTGTDASPEQGSAAFDRDTPVQGELFIEFTDADGVPLPAETVEISVDGAPGPEPTCMDDTCGIWVGEYAAMGRVSAWATSCGHRFGATVALGPEVDEASPYDVSLTIVGVAGLCTPANPIP